ncbi:histone-lysine n-methyltransferase clr4 [Niveomyces insectorum RCEF 264]|uniref:Histone-lysine n-methyltransferase clr4 n=1 Tax=Niveomyces insectorum RCEF 264 TaxID=1081102 RepID=A0A167XWY1_9HYPO|nr:histone-lysine n-methyltransferase clr4 [Niveomyces insectorum RCEF 264]
MGCCFSRAEGPNSPYPGGASSASARAINVPSSVAVESASAAIVPAPSSAAAAHGEAASLLSSSPATIASQRSRPQSPASPQSTPQQRLHQHQHQWPRRHHPLPGSGAAPNTLAQHINKPLRRRPWTSRNRVWTRHTIDRERRDFFDTRVTGRAEIWQTLHAALVVLWEADLVTATAAAAAAVAADTDTDTTRTGGGVAAPTAATAKAVATATPRTTTKETTTETATAVSTETKEGDSDVEADEARATAQSMLDAADITLPTGYLAQGAYDAFGNFYALPAWIVADPTNLVDDPNQELAETQGMLQGSDDDDDDDVEAGDGDSSDGAVEGADDNDDDSVFESSDDEDTCREDDVRPKSGGGHPPPLRPPPSGRHRRRQGHHPSRHRREEKGKAAAVAADQVAVRARLSATSRDVVIRVGREETVRSLAHRISEEAKLPHKTRIRIAYLGKILKDSASLNAQGWKEGHVVNALVFDAS